MYKFLLSFIFILAFTFKVSSETIKEIIVENNDRVSKSTIINFSKIKIGDEVDDQVLNNIIKDLYETKFFADVKVEFVDQKLIIDVFENKIIQSVVLNGIKAKKFREAIFDSIKLLEKSPYDEYMASQDLLLIKQALISQGFFFSNVTTSSVDNQNGTIDLIYDIEMGERALVKNIEFTGNKVFKSNKLRNIITSEENKFWKFISSKKFLNKEQLKLDERLLKRFYLNRGYYNVKISSVFAKLLDDGDFKVVFNIDAGNIYRINKAELILPIDYDVDNFIEINKLLEKLEDTKYSFIKLNKIVDEIDVISLNKEFEFINASIEESILDNNFLDLIITISETKKKYVERINISGNNITQENVIRSQLQIDEGDAYNELLQSKSINNLRALGIFKDVSSSTRNGSTDQQKILDITVTEKPTGEISLGAGIGTDGGTVGFSVSENNYMGKGIKLKSSLRISTDTVRGQFSVVNPNYKYSDKTISTNVQSTQIDKLTNNGYKSTKTGFSLGTGFEQYEDLYFNPSIGVFYENLTTSSTASNALKKQEGSFFDTSFRYSLDYDKRNQKYMTSDGFRSTFSQKIPLLSDVYTLGNTYEIKKFYKLPNEMVTSFTFFANSVNAISDKDVRISERVKLHSSRLKGFEHVGPVDNGDYIGGNYASAINFTTSLPMIFQSLDNTEVSYFVDMGSVWGVDYSSSIDDSSKVRSSTGITVNWFTPIGPLNFSLAQPINTVSTDKTQTFQFSLGTTF
jgi:outer membrane protein insertion porin family